MNKKKTVVKSVGHDCVIEAPAYSNILIQNLDELGRLASAIHSIEQDLSNKVGILVGHKLQENADMSRSVPESCYASNMEYLLREINDDLVRIESHLDRLPNSLE